MKTGPLSSFIYIFAAMIPCLSAAELPLRPSSHDLVFAALAGSWDEAVPLGNGMLGALVWKNGGRLRMSLDRADLWDLRPMENMNGPEWTFHWVQEQWKKNDYKPVQDRFDKPYDADPAPSKIPAGALEFDLGAFGPPESVTLFVHEAVCKVSWPGGKFLETFVHATKPLGWFRIKGAGRDVRPLLIMPPFRTAEDSGPTNPVTGQDLRRLGYEQGRVKELENAIAYHQIGWGGFYYDIAVAWRSAGPDEWEGVWSVSSRFSDERKETAAAARVQNELSLGYSKNFACHG